MKEAVDSVWGSVKDRFTNPFLGTFLFVWIIRNWYLVYAIFSFDKECTLDDKLEYFKNYFIAYKWYTICLEFLINVGITLLLLSVTYLFLVGVQYLMRYYKLLISKANAKFDKIPVESMSHYLTLNIQFKSLGERYKSLDNKNNELLTEIQVQETNILKLKSEQLELHDNFKDFAYYCLANYPWQKFLSTSPIYQSDALENYDAMFSLIGRVLSTQEIKEIIINYIETESENSSESFKLYLEKKYLTFLTQDSINNNYEGFDKHLSNLKRISKHIEHYNPETIQKFEILTSTMLDLFDGNEPSHFGEDILSKLFGY